MSEHSTPFDHPWAEDLIGNIATVTVGGTPSTAIKKYWDGDVPWMASGDVHLKRIEDVPQRISELGLRHSNATLVDPPSVAIALAGQGKTRGTAALVLTRLCTNQSVALITSTCPDVVIEYVFFDLGFRYDELRSRSAGGGRAGLTKHLIEQVPMPVPPKQEQIKIAEVLAACDRAIAKTEGVANKQRRIKIGMMYDLLTCGIDEHGRIRSNKTHAFHDTPLGLLPEGWDVKSIGELLADVDPPMRSGPFGSALRKDEWADSGIPLLGIDNVFPEEFVADYTRFVPPQKAERLKRYRVRPRDIMVTIMGTVGRCCVVPDDIGTALSSKHTWTISLDQNRYSPYLACLQINYAPWVLRHFTQDEQGGIMSAIKSATLRSTLLPVPPPDEMKLIEQRMKAISAAVECETHTLRKFRSLKAGLMQDLLTGRRRVTPLLAASPELAFQS